MGADPHGCCDTYRDHLLSVNYGAGGMPTRRPRANAVNATEAEWDRDMPAYKRLVEDGLQPDQIDGCHRLEAVANHELEVETNTLLREVPT